MNTIEDSSVTTPTSEFSDDGRLGARVPLLPRRPPEPSPAPFPGLVDALVKAGNGPNPEGQPRGPHKPVASKPFRMVPRRKITWVIITAGGCQYLSEADKRTLMAQENLSVPLRDLRIMDSYLSHPVPQLLVRDNAFVFAMEELRLLITADKVMLPVSLDSCSDLSNTYVRHLLDHLSAAGDDSRDALSMCMGSADGIASSAMCERDSVPPSRSSSAVAAASGAASGTAGATDTLYPALFSSPLPSWMRSGPDAVGRARTMRSSTGTQDLPGRPPRPPGPHQLPGSSADGAASRAGTGGGSERRLGAEAGGKPAGEDEKLEKPTWSRRDVPFELRALELALQLVHGSMAREVRCAERQAYPALDALTASVTKHKLERVRRVKTLNQRLLGRVHGIREQLERYLDDDQDMWKLCLTRRKEAALEPSGAAAMALAHHMGSIHRAHPSMRPPGSPPLGSQPAAEPPFHFWNAPPAGPAASSRGAQDPPPAASRPSQEPEQASARRGGGSGAADVFVVSPRPSARASGTVASRGSLELVTVNPSAGTAEDLGVRTELTDPALQLHADVEEVENLLESYFVQVDGLYSRLMSLEEYVKDTEEFINIELDSARNKLIQIEILVTVGTFGLAMHSWLAGILGENLQLPDFLITIDSDTGKPTETGFWWTNGVMFAVAAAAFLAIAGFMKIKKIM